MYVCVPCFVVCRGEATSVRSVLAILLATRLPAQAYGHTHWRASLPVCCVCQALHAEELTQRAYAHTPAGACALPCLWQGFLPPRTVGAPLGSSPGTLIGIQLYTVWRCSQTPGLGPLHQKALAPEYGTLSLPHSHPIFPVDLGLRTRFPSYTCLASLDGTCLGGGWSGTLPPQT